MLIGLALQVLTWKVFGRSLPAHPEATRLRRSSMSQREEPHHVDLSEPKSFKDSQPHISATYRGLFLYLQCITRVCVHVKHNKNNQQDKLRQQRWRLMQYSRLELVERCSRLISKL